MKITIITIANKMPLWVRTASDEYLKRINTGHYSCKIVQLKPEKNMQLETKRIVENIPNNSFVIALDEKGKNFTSNAFAQNLTKANNIQITFIIGGANGICQELKQKVNQTLQLSTLTYPHTLVRVIILEQLYRAITILTGHPYHRE